MHKCTNCGTEFEGKFCPECGTKWESEEATNEQTPSPVPGAAAGTATPLGAPAGSPIAAGELDERRAKSPSPAITEFSPKQSEMLARARMIVRMPYIFLSFTALSILIVPIMLIRSCFDSTSGRIDIVFASIMSVFALAGIALLAISLWLQFTKKTLSPKALFKKGKLSPEKFFAQKYKNARYFISSSFGLAVFGIIFAVILPSENGFFNIRRVALQVGETANYFILCIAVVFGVLIFTGATVLGILAAQNALYCKKFTEAPEHYPEYTTTPELFARDLARVPLPVSVRRIRGSWLTGAVVCLLVAAIAIGTVVNSNIFTEGKLNKIELGASQNRVEDVLGSTSFEEPGEWNYFSDNAVSLIKKQQQLQLDLIGALAEGDLERIEALTEESEKLLKKVANMEYRTIRVVFDAADTVARIEMFEGDRSTVLENSKYCSSKKVTLSPASIPLAEFMAGTTEITYSAEFNDGNYVRARLGAVEIFSDSAHDQAASIDTAGTYYLKWTDSFGECTAVLQVT